MKKILFMLAIAASLVACGGPYEVEITQKPEPQLELVKRPQKFEYKEHTYIAFEFVSGGYYSSLSGIVHDPDCKCHAKNKD